MSDCAEIQRELRAGRALDEKQREHLRSCSACTAMKAVAHHLGATDRTPAPDSAARAALTEALGRERGWWARARELPTRVRMVGGIAIAVAVPAFILIFAPRPDLGVYPAIRLVLELGIVVLLATWSATLALRPLQRPFSIAIGRATLACGLLAAMAIASLPAAHHDHAASLAGVGDDFVPRAIGCFVYASVMAIPVALALLAFARDLRSGPRAPLLALAAALAGFAAVAGHCPIVASSHQWAGHVAVFVPFLAAAAWLRRARRS